MAPLADSIKKAEGVLTRLRSRDSGIKDAEDACYAARDIWKFMYRRGVVAGGTTDALAMRARKCLNEALEIVLHQREQAMVRRKEEATAKLSHYAENVEFRLALCELLLADGIAAVHARILKGIPELVDKDLLPEGV